MREVQKIAENLNNSLSVTYHESEAELLKQFS